MWRVALAAVPAWLGLGAALLLESGLVRHPIVYLRGHLGTLGLLCGLGLAALMLGSLLLRQRHAQALAAARAEAAAEAARDRRRFLQRLDHELKNPITAIRAGLANLAAEAPGEALASVDAQARRLSRLTADLRKLAELETRPLERTPVDVGELLQQVVELARDRPEAADRRLTLTLPHAPWPLPVIAADRDLLLLVAHNLLDNALKFTRPGDTIEVRAAEDGAQVVIELADTGPGIAADDLPQVWEELYRGQGARGVPGSGLGLALVRAIVERHGGQVGVRSRAGQGTVLMVRLPVRAAADDARP
jgi:two-component system OmpR family sensor kinase